MPSESEDDASTVRDSSLWVSFLSIVSGLAFIWFFQSVGAEHFRDFQLGVGSITVPKARMMYFSGFWLLLGGAAVVLLSLGFNGLLDRLKIGERLGSGGQLKEVHLLAGGVVLACLIPGTIRWLILHGAPVTDDESAYRFMAELIASGRLVAQSPPEPLKLFFDRFQMVNDGERFSQYFIGWPALMAPGTWLGIGDWMNLIFSALTVPPLFLTARRIGGRRAAVLAVLLYLASPFLMASAATVGAHTSCLAALAWTFWAFFDSRQDDQRWYVDSIFALAFSVAFFIRPLTALGLAGPLVAVWLWDRWQHRGSEDWRRLFAFSLPALVMAGLFLAVNQIQSGSPFAVAYTSFLEYAEQNGGRFVGVRDFGDRIPNLKIADLQHGGATLGLAIYRFNLALFGWPVSLIFLVVAGLSGGRKYLWATLVSFLVFHLSLSDPGIDLFGPVHFQELALPVILLSALGIERAAEWGGRLNESGTFRPPSNPVRLPIVATGVAIFLSVSIYLPVRFGMLAQAADNTRLVDLAVEHSDLGEAVVFSPRPFIPNCLIEPARHYVFWRPVNSPDFRDRILWVNHISLKDNRRLMEYMPGRTGYYMGWTEKCVPRFVPLERLGEDSVPDSPVARQGKGPDWSVAPDPSVYQFPEPR